MGRGTSGALVSTARPSPLLPSCSVLAQLTAGLRGAHAGAGATAPTEALCTCARSVGLRPASIEDRRLDGRGGSGGRCAGGVVPAISGRWTIRPFHPCVRPHASGAVQLKLCSLECWPIRRRCYRELCALRRCRPRRGSPAPPASPTPREPCRRSGALLSRTCKEACLPRPLPLPLPRLLPPRYACEVNPRSRHVAPCAHTC